MVEVAGQNFQLLLDAAKSGAAVAKERYRLFINSQRFLQRDVSVLELAGEHFEALQRRVESQFFDGPFSRYFFGQVALLQGLLGDGLASSYEESRLIGVRFGAGYLAVQPTACQLYANRSTYLRFAGAAQQRTLVVLAQSVAAAKHRQRAHGLRACG